MQRKRGEVPKHDELLLQNSRAGARHVYLVAQGEWEEDIVASTGKIAVE